MITQAKVRAVSDHAGRLSDGEFGLQAIGGDIGHGARYIDRRRQLVWTGRDGGRRAACYYLGVIAAFSGAASDDETAAVRSELIESRGWYVDEYIQGKADAKSWQRTRRN